MLTLTQMQDTAARIGYRGWSFTVREHPYEGPMLRIVATVDDAYNPAERVDLGIDSFIPPMVSVDAFCDFILWRLLRVASHEVREFFLFDGVRLFDPHAQEVAA